VERTDCDCVWERVAGEGRGHILTVSEQFARDGTRQCVTVLGTDCLR